MIAINKSGRAPRAGVQRYPGGQIKHNERRPIETPEQVRATALDARVRHILGVDEWLKAKEAKEATRDAREKVDDTLLGSALGRLLYVGLRDKAGADGISKHQYSAGTYFIWLYTTNARLRGWPSLNVRAIDYGAVTGGLSVHAEDSEEWVMDIRRKWEDMYRGIIDADHGRGDVFEALKRVLIEDKGLDDQAALGSLRVGLNAINRVRGV